MSTSNVVDNLVQYITAAATPKLAVDYKTASRLTSLSEQTLRKLCMTGELPSRKVGHRRIISLTELERLVR